MFLREKKVGKYTYLELCTTRINKNGRRSQVAVKRFGNLETLQQKDPEFVAKLRARYEAQKQTPGVEFTDDLDSMISAYEEKVESSFIRQDNLRSVLLDYGIYIIKPIWEDLLSLKYKLGYIYRNDVNYGNMRKIDINRRRETDLAKAAAQEVNALNDIAFFLTALKVTHPELQGRCLEVSNRYLGHPLAGISADNLEYTLTLISQYREEILFLLGKRLLRFYKECGLSQPSSVYYYDTISLSGATAESGSEGALLNVVLALDTYGTPLDFEVYTSRGHDPKKQSQAFDRLRRRHQFRDTVVMADPAMTANPAFSQLIDSGLGCARVLNAGQMRDLGDDLLDLSTYKAAPAPGVKSRIIENPALSEISPEWEKDPRFMICTYDEEQAQSDLLRVSHDLKLGILKVGQLSDRRAEAGFRAYIVQLPQSANVELLKPELLRGLDAVMAVHTFFEQIGCGLKVGVRPESRRTMLTGELLLNFIGAVCLRIIQIRLSSSGHDSTMPEIIAQLRDAHVTAFITSYDKGWFVNAGRCSRPQPGAKIAPALEEGEDVRQFNLLHEIMREFALRPLATVSTLKQLSFQLKVKFNRLNETIDLQHMPQRY